MKRWLFIVGCTLCLLPDLCAQEIQVKRFAETQEINWAPKQRRDNNGVICALVRVVVPLNNDVLFQGNVIGEIAYRGNEYCVYLSEGSRYLGIHYPGCETLFVDFKSLGYDGLHSKRVYELVLTLPDELRYGMPDVEPVRRSSEESVRQMKIIRDAVNRLGVQYIGPFMNGIAPVRKDGKVAFVDKSGNLVTAFSFDDCSNRISEDNFYLSNYWVVSQNGLFGIINSGGELIVDCQYRTLYAGVNNLLALSEDKLRSYDPASGLIMTDLRKYVKTDFDVINGLTGNLIASKVDFEVMQHLLRHGSSDIPRARDKYFVNSEGKRLFGKKYRRVYPFSENLACVFTKSYDYVVIDRNGELLTQLPPGFELEQDWFSNHYWENEALWYKQNFITGVHDGLLAVSRSETDKMGYINMMGELVIPCQYDNAEPFSNGLAAVESDNQWLYINKRGDVVFRHPKSLFKKCWIFKNGVAVGEFEENVLDSVSKISYTHAIYDTSGKILLKGTNILHNIVQYYDDCFKYKLYPAQGISPNGSNIFGYINSNFELVIPYQFSFVEPFKDEFTSVKGEKGYGLLDSYGNVVWLNEEESENLLKEER